MKKAFSVFAVSLLLLTAGCSKRENPQTAPPAAPAAFTANVAVTYGGTEMTAEFTQNAAGDYEIRFLTPKALSPLSLVYRNEICEVTYDTLSFEADLDRFPQVEMGTVLTDAISDVIEGIDVQTTYSDGIWTYTGAGERGTFTLTRDGETDAWLEFNVDGAQLNIKFSDFKTN